MLFSGLIAISASAQANGYTGVFGGGPFYKNPATVTEIAGSGFTEAIVWSVEVGATGDLNFNGEFPLTAGGVYIGEQTYPGFAAGLAQLKQGSVKRVTFSIGSSNYGDWEDIAALVKAQGTGPDSILYKDFLALKAAIPALDAIDFDDENSYDASSTVQFAVMLAGLGYHVMPDPYVKSAYWESVVAQINAQAPGTVDGVHLQAYSGGAGNTPCSGWNFGSVPVFPGLWDANYSPSQVQSIMTQWNAQCGISGGFMWLYDDFAGTGEAAQYASAINTAVSGSGFTLAGPSGLFLDQGAGTGAAVTITDLGGFGGAVDLGLSGLPAGVTGRFVGQGNKRLLRLAAAADAATGYAGVTVTGTSGGIVQTTSFTLAVSAATGGRGSGTPVDLSALFNRYGIYDDGTRFTTGGLDGAGYAYSANLLGTTRVLGGLRFALGPADDLDAVACAGQTLALPAHRYGRLALMAAAVEGNQPGQRFTITYSDGSTRSISQDFSDWYTPQAYGGEQLGVAMPYRDAQDGTQDLRDFNLYAYDFALSSRKTVQSITLPDNPNLVLLALTLGR